MHASDVNAEWIERVLHANGTLPATTRITGARVNPIGTGQVAESVRVELEVDGEAPFTSLVAKVSSDNQDSRAAGRTELNYLREVRFYEQVAPRLSARVPQCYYAEIDSNGTEFVLLLEDLSPATAGNQLDGSTLADVEGALRQAAGFHAPFWGTDEFDGSEWLDISGSYWVRFEEMMPQWWEGFRDRYQAKLTEDQVAFGDRFVGGIAKYYELMRTLPATIQHGDFRPDNILFGVDGDAASMAVVDWQTVLLAPGAVDAAYCVGGALPVETRREHEDHLFDVYFAELERLGVKTDRDEVKRGYAAGTLHNFIIGVAAAMLVVRTERGDALFHSMVTNAVTHAQDQGALEQIGITR
ncbi:phosphotransferase [Nocardioides sp. AE5]|uniref:phosphotransferase n=1 Tax=Nocardioides sp. AE5 TaxID=2962573 RepID=UPI0028812030|nr:phosphotransferase [Nocardioides sp. AE5]MDT0201653.1 phosphotransferase [Nocardioides sp. AE5]